MLTIYLIGFLLFYFGHMYYFEKINWSYSIAALTIDSFFWPINVATLTFGPNEIGRKS